MAITKYIAAYVVLCTSVLVVFISGNTINSSYTSPENNPILLSIHDTDEGYEVESLDHDAEIQQLSSKDGENHTSPGYSKDAGIEQLYDEQSDDNRLYNSLPGDQGIDHDDIATYTIQDDEKDTSSARDDSILTSNRHSDTLGKHRAQGYDPDTYGVQGDISGSQRDGLDTYRMQGDDSNAGNVDEPGSWDPYAKPQNRPPMGFGRRPISPDSNIRSNDYPNSHASRLPVRTLDQEFDIQPIDAFLRKCPDCFMYVDNGICPLNDAALEMKTWAHELGDLLSFGCSRQHCDDKCCVAQVAPVSLLVAQMTRMVKNTYHLFRQHCHGCKGLNPRPEDVSWSTWSVFCACDCHTGLELRSRKCMENGREVHVARCAGLPGAARDSRRCDVRKSCPGCITNCHKVSDGEYPACSSCSDYVSCRAGTAQRFHCKKGTEFDAFVRRCVVPPSPSCSLVSAPYTCTGLSAGKYPAPNTCTAYTMCSSGSSRHVKCKGDQEYNQHFRACQSLPSPTCVRSLFSRYMGDRPYGDEAVDSYTHIAYHHNHDGHLAPDYMYYDEAHGLTPTERREMYALGVNEEQFKAMEATLTREEVMKAVREVEDELKEEEDEEEEEEVGNEEYVNDEEEYEGDYQDDEGDEEESDVDEYEEEEEDNAEDNEEDNQEDNEEDEDVEETDGTEDDVLLDDENSDDESKKEVIDRIRKDDQHRRRKAEGRLRRVQPVCMSSCVGVTPGNYPACNGCRRYVFCNKDGVLRKRKCPTSWEFDAAVGECVQGKSDTCVEEE